MRRDLGAARNWHFLFAWIFVINGLLFWFVGTFITGFVVAGFWWGVAGAIAYSIVSWALSAVLLPSGPSR